MYQIKNEPYQCRYYGHSHSLNISSSGASGIHDVVVYNYVTKVESNLRHGFYDKTYYGNQLTLNDKTKCEKNEFRLPWNSDWTRLTIGLDFSDHFDPTFTQFNYVGENLSNSTTWINCPNTA